MITVRIEALVYDFLGSWQNTIENINISVCLFYLSIYLPSFSISVYLSPTYILSICLSAWLPLINLSLPACLPTYLPIIYPTFPLTFYQFLSLSINILPPTHLPIYLIFFKLDHSQLLDWLVFKCWASCTNQNRFPIVDESFVRGSDLLFRA